jgi:hypothetical protein
VPADALWPVLPHDALAALPHDALPVLLLAALAALPHDVLAALPYDVLAALPRDVLAALPRDASRSSPHGVFLLPPDVVWPRRQAGEVPASFGALLPRLVSLPIAFAASVVLPAVHPAVAKVFPQAFFIRLKFAFYSSLFTNHYPLTTIH